MTPQEKELRGAQAAAVRPVLEPACEAIRAELLNAIAASPLGATATREQLYLTINALDRLDKALIAYVAEGRFNRSLAEHAALLTPAAQDRR